MRTSRFAIATCTALLGVGTLVSQAVPSGAAPPPQQGTIVLQGGNTIGDYAPSPPTTKPAPKPDVDFGDFELVNPGPIDPPDQPDAPDFDLEADQGTSVQDPTPPEDGECTPGSTIDPDCVPCTPVPGGPECPGDEPCVPDSTVPGTPDEQCPEPCDPLTEDCDPCEPNGPSVARGYEDCDPCRPQNDGPNLRDRDDCDPCEDDDVVRHYEDCDPCEERPERPDAPKRNRGEDCDPCLPEGDTGGGNAVRHGDPECPGEGTTGGDDGGTDGPDRGRLPHTGGDIAVFVGAGLGLTGLGTLLRRIGRR